MSPKEIERALRVAGLSRSEARRVLHDLGTAALSERFDVSLVLVERARASGVAPRAIELAEAAPEPDKNTAFVAAAQALMAAPPPPVRTTLPKFAPLRRQLQREAQRRGALSSERRRAQKL